MFYLPRPDLYRSWYLQLNFIMETKIILNSFLIIAFFLLTNCKADNKSMKVKIFNKGVESEVILINEDSKTVKEILFELLLKTDDMMRIYFDSTNIEEIKHSEKCIEIIFDKVEHLNTGFLGEVSLNKILLPISGDFKPTEKTDIVTIIIGENEYSSGPLTASGGLKLIMQLEKIVFQNSR